MDRAKLIPENEPGEVIVELSFRRFRVVNISDCRNKDLAIVVHFQLRA